MRKYSRIPFDTEARLELSGRFLSARILDISMKGVLLELPENEDIPMGSLFNLTIPLLDEASSIHMRAVLRHREEGHIGCEWVGIDIDSITSLHRMLELNIADNTVLERELHQLCHG